MFGADLRGEMPRVLLDRKSLRHFERRPEPIVRTRRRRVGRADHAVTGERIFAKEILERVGQALVRNLPRHQRAGGKVRRHQRLAHAADRAGIEHRDDALEHDVHIDARLLGDLTERVELKAGQPVFTHCENRRVYRVVDPRGQGTCHERGFTPERWHPPQRERPLRLGAARRRR
jgi:hypothetical protein